MGEKRPHKGLPVETVAETQKESIMRVQTADGDVGLLKFREGDDGNAKIDCFDRKGTDFSREDVQQNRFTIKVEEGEITVQDWKSNPVVDRYHLDTGTTGNCPAYFNKDQYIAFSLDFTKPVAQLAGRQLEEVICGVTAAILAKGAKAAVAVTAICKEILNAIESAGVGEKMTYGVVDRDDKISLGPIGTQYAPYIAWGFAPEYKASPTQINKVLGFAGLHI